MKISGIFLVVVVLSITFMVDAVCVSHLEATNSTKNAVNKENPEDASLEHEQSQPEMTTKFFTPIKTYTSIVAPEICPQGHLKINGDCREVVDI